MRVLTVRQPWAWAIIHGGKDVENRTRNIAGDYRGPVAIHVSLTDDESVLDYGHPMAGLFDWVCPRRRDVTHNTTTCVLCAQARLDRVWADQGHIIGVVDLVGVHKGHNTEKRRSLAVRSCFRPGKPFGPCSVWAEADALHLELTNPRSLDVPMPWKGALGLRDLPEDVAARLAKETGR